MDQSKKTMRHFYCRDVLWEVFEGMANDFDCSIDYLINEAMRYYARSKNYLSADQGPKGGGGGRVSASMEAAQQPAVAPPPPPPPAARPGASGSPTLYLIYDNRKIAVDKEQFIIGRGSKTSDLAIKDGNISRKHAAIIQRNGTYYIKDLGSTNGIDYKGMRIDNKRIDEGDIFHICDYELRFTYR